MKKRTSKQMDGASVPFSLALYNETEGHWDNRDQREQFWNREDVPERLRGEGPERPDPRVLLFTDDKTEYAEAKAEWEKESAAWTKKRIDWLRRAAAKERT